MYTKFLTACNTAATFARSPRFTAWYQPVMFGLLLLIAGVMYFEQAGLHREVLQLRAATAQKVAVTDDDIRELRGDIRVLHHGIDRIEDRQHKAEVQLAINPVVPPVAPALPKHIKAIIPATTTSEPPVLAAATKSSRHWYYLWLR